MGSFKINNYSYMLKTLILNLFLFLVSISSGFGQNVVHYQSHQVTGNLLKVKTEANVYTIHAYSNDMVRIGFYPDTNLISDESKVVIKPAGNEGVITDQTEELLYQTKNITISIHKAPFRMSLIYKGDTLLKEKDGFYFTGGQTYVSFTCSADEAFHGTGFRAIDINLRGRSLTMNNQAHYGYTKGTANLNVSIPFIVSSKKYGIYFDHLYPGAVQLGVTDNTLLYQTSQKGLSYFFIGSDNMPSLLDEYTELTGKAPVPPRWALGYIQSKYGYQNQTEAINIVDKMQNDKFPMDGLVLDLYWFGNSGSMGNLNWSPVKFPQPVSMISDFKHKGVKTILITEPYFTANSANYDTITKSNFAATNSLNEPYVVSNFWAGSSVLLDMMDTLAQNWMWEFYKSRINEGVAGWWCDLGEPESHPSDMFHKGKSAAEVHNYYSWEWSRMLQKKYAQHFPHERLFNLIRSGYAGMQRFGAIPWSGDIQRSYAGMQAQIPIMTNMGYSGVGYMHSDLGGFTGGSQDNELYTRWLQFGAFCPIMRAHGEGVATEPVNYPDPYRSIVRSFIELRYKLLPYNYSLALYNALTGAPLARSMDYNNPEKTSFNNINDQYFWGENMLIAPMMVKNTTSRTIILPEGNWVDYLTNKIYAGNKTITVNASIETMPVFIKAGSFIPHTSLVMSTDNYKADNLSVWFYPDMNVPVSKYTLMNDDGVDPNSLANHEYETIDFTGTYNFDSTTIQVTHQGSFSAMPAIRQLEFRIKNIIDQPDSVIIGGTGVAVVLDTMRFNSIYPAAYYDSTLNEIYIHTKWNNDSLKIVIKSMVAMYAKTMNKNELNLKVFPNWIKDQSTIEYAVTESGTYRLELIDCMGVTQHIFFNRFIHAGNYSMDWMIQPNIVSGKYYVRLIGESMSITKPVMIIH